MNDRRLLSLLITVILASGTPLGASDASDGPCVLFVSTAPIGARVFLNGERIARSTPLLFRDITSGRHTIEIRKDGYSDQSLTIDLEPGEKKAVEVGLTRHIFGESFPTEERVKIVGVEEEGRGAIFLLPEGTYNFQQVEESLRIDPHYPEQNLIDGLNLAIPLALIFSGLITAGEIFFPPEIGQPLSPVVFTSHAVTLSLIGLDLALHVKKQRRREAQRAAYRRREGPLTAKQYYASGETMLKDERFIEALDAFTQIVTKDSDSELLPFALYKIAKIHHILGENTLAVGEYLVVIEDYPHPRLYDKARKGLADLLFDLGEYEESLSQLDAMVLWDPLYSKEEIDRQREEIIAETNQ